MERGRAGLAVRRPLSAASAAVALAAVGLAACGTAPAVQAPPPPGARVVVFEGTCDASGAVPIDGRLFVVADDEDNVLRVYDAERGGAPLSQADVSESLGLPLKGKKRPRPAEMDLEGGTRLGERAWWLASHGRASDGELRPERLKLFATTLPDAASPATGGSIRLVGPAYDRLLPDLLAADSLAPFGLAAAAERAPKEPGGLNIEGLTSTPTGELLLGFRNPVPGGRALLVPLVNPGELVPDAPSAAGALPAAATPPATARFGAPVQIDLGGQGVRSLSWWRGRFLIIAGAIDSGGASRLYTWTGGPEPAVAVNVDLTWLNPEGFFSPEDRDEILLLSDDGEVEIDGKACKKLRDPARKRFRAVWVPVSGS